MRCGRTHVLWYMLLDCKGNIENKNTLFREDFNQLCISFAWLLLMPSTFWGRCVEKGVICTLISNWSEQILHLTFNLIIPPSKSYNTPCTVQLQILTFPTERDRATFWDKGAEVPSFSQDILKQERMVLNRKITFFQIY